VHNEAIVIPETIDAIRALSGIESDWTQSVRKTDQSLGIVKSFLPRTIPEETVHAAMGEALAAARREFMEEGFKGREEPAEAVPTEAQRR